MANFLLNETLTAAFTDIAAKHGMVIRRKFIEETLADHDLIWESVKHLLEDDTIVFKPKRGSYDITNIMRKINGDDLETKPIATNDHKDIENEGGLRVISGVDVCVPSLDPIYVKWGNYSDIEDVIQSGHFFPVYLSGDSGNGKTKMIEQACANNARQFVRIQINEATDEDDLIGGLRIIDGETVFVEGPVVSAMRAGATLLLDEIDRGSDKIMCLQGILEGNPFLIKRTGQIVAPASGFNVIATGNTNGRGDLTGRFNASILDEAFLERFAILMEQDHPSEAVTRKVVDSFSRALMIDDSHFTEALLEWSVKIVKTRPDDLTPVVSIRRIELIMKSYTIFKKADKAINYGIQRFDEATRLTYRAYWKTIHEDLEAARAAAAAEKRLDALSQAAQDAAARAASRVIGGTNTASTTSNMTTSSPF